ncbi:MAG: tRNA-dihydrouridine synthase, partial [Anaerovibrio sp.]|nr:tRNA-dihydrouridine synthase [Anaerovibrio sp.]
REKLRIPVIANGDIRNVEDLIKIREVTGCEAVMVGRAAQGNPWIFRQLTHYLRTGEILPGPTMEERKEIIIRHLDMLMKFKGDYVGPREMRKHATWYTRGIKGNAELRVQFNKAESREDFLRILEKMK